MDYEKTNTVISRKTAGLKSRLQLSIAAKGIRHQESDSNPGSLADIKVSTSQQFGVTNRIRVRFKKSGVYVHKGVGRGTKASQAGTGKRVAKEWFNPVIEKFADELMEELADEMANTTLNAINIK